MEVIRQAEAYPLYIRYSIKILALAILFLAPNWANAACATPFTKSGNTYTCADASYDCINDAVQAAAAEDIVNITDTTSRTWSSTLVIPLGIELKGPGLSRLTITNNIASNGPLIIYAPSAVAGAYDYGFSVHGFTFDTAAGKGIALCGSTGGACTTSNNMGAIAQTKIKIHDNAFITTVTPRSTADTAIEVKGAFRGVVYSNSFTGYSTPNRAWGTGLGSTDWVAFGPYAFGTADTMYYEDNVFTAGGYMISDCDQGGRYSYRYNTINADGDLLPSFENHIGRTSGGADYYGCFGGEMYGNKIVRNGHNVTFLSQHSGKILGFNNQTGDASSQITLQQNISGSWSDCPPGDSAMQSNQTINSSYYWNNRKTATGGILDAVDAGDHCTEHPITEGATFWDDTTSSGVRCGTLANLPATCTTGQAYWATNQKCDDLTGMVGASPSTPISGTLYKCTSTNTWEPYYTPYTYPHPLRVQKFTGNTCVGCGGYYN